MAQPNHGSFPAMATAYYAQPAAANYHTPAAHQHRQRGYRICDQCGAAETPTVRFRLCGGCVSIPYSLPPRHSPDLVVSFSQMTTQYCVSLELFLSFLSLTNAFGFSRQTARRSTGQLIVRFASTRHLRWLGQSSRLSPLSGTRISRRTCVTSPRRTQRSSVGQGSRPSSLSEFPPTSDKTLFLLSSTIVITRSLIVGESSCLHFILRWGANSGAQLLSRSYSYRAPSIHSRPTSYGRYSTS